MDRRKDDFDLDVALAQCEREPIHVPGAIQPHGVLFAARSVAPYEVLQASANVEAQLGLPVHRVLGASVVDLSIASSRDVLAGALVDASTRRSHTLPLVLGDRCWDAVVHRSADLSIIELEPATRLDPLAASAEQAAVRELTTQVLAAGSAAALHQLLVEPLRALTGYERVMVYLFDETGDGAVVAEARDPALEPYLGLRYPASDIPVQARRLYVTEPSRTIVDADYDPIPLVPALRPDTGAPLDLSHAALRSVSKIHCMYLANMGVRGSMSISLIDEDRLFGLIAFHHRSPHLLRYELRDAVASLGRVAAFVHLARTREQVNAEFGRAAVIKHRLLEQMQPDHDEVAGLAGPDVNVLDMIAANGAIVRYRDAIRLLGDAPPLAFAERLADWLIGEMVDGLYLNDRLPAAYPPAAEHLDTACGVLAVAIGGDGLVAWLRTEVIRTVEWGGNPNTPIVRDGDGQLGPRRSFALWRERVRGQSLPFEPWQRSIAECLRWQLVDIVLRRVSELDRLNLELRAALEARDDFLSIASHELKTPLSTLLLAIESLALGASTSGALDDRITRRLDVARRQIVRLDRLVTGLLDVSRMQSGKLELELEHADLAATVQEVIERMAIDAGAVTIGGEPSVPCRYDRLRVDQVITNLVSNALKYAGEGPIEVEVATLGSRARLIVRDHGPGIPAELRTTLFDRFVRANDTSAATGFGLGLWITRAIVLAHGGDIRPEETPGGGTTMVVELHCEGPPLDEELEP